MMNQIETFENDVNKLGLTSTQRSNLIKSILDTLAAKAKEIKETAEKYKRGEYIDIKAINKSRSAQDETKKKTTKRKNKRNTKKKGR